MAPTIHALVIDPDAHGRMLLKNAAASMARRCRLKQAWGLEQALQELTKPIGDAFDVVFLAYEFERAKVPDFIWQAKKTLRGRDAAYILLVPAENQDAKTVAEKLLEGTDGFLLKPYSVESLNDITTLALKIRDKRRDERERAMLVLLANDAVKYLDRVVSSLARKEDPGRAIKQMREIKDLVSKLDAELLPRFLQIVRGLLKDLPLPSDEDGAMLQGQDAAAQKRPSAAERLRRQMESLGIDAGDLGQDTHNSEAAESRSYFRYIPEEGKIALKENLCSAQVLDSITEMVERCLQRGEKAIVFDLSDVELINSYGVGKILSCEQQVKRNTGRVSVRSAQGLVKEAFELFHLEQLLNIDSPTEK